MSIREDVVASATKFLQDPAVASSPVQNRIAFLQAKNLTQPEIDLALARAADATAGPTQHTSPVAAPPPPQFQPGPYYSQDAAYVWRYPPPEPPRRDWRDWFIMATVVGGVGYGAYQMVMRYIYPLIAEPNPGRLQEDKKLVDEQFERVFALMDQLAENTAKLEAAEAERVKHFDSALADLERAIAEVKEAQDTRDEDAKRVRDDIRSLKTMLPRSLEAHKEVNDNRMRDIVGELKSLKTLVSQRVNPNATSTSVGNYLRPSSGNASVSPSHSMTPSATGEENAGISATTEKDQNLPSQYAGSGMPASRAASIPAWQRAMQPQTQQATAGRASPLPGAVSPVAGGSGTTDIGQGEAESSS